MMGPDLIEALRAAGAIDTDVAQLARPDVSVATQVLDLQQRYPAAFVPVAKPFDARTATKAEFDAAWRKLQSEEFQRSVDAIHAHNMRDMERRFGVKK